MKKTQAMRALDRKGIPYRATVYDESGCFHSAEEAAQILGISLAAMYKTLVLLRDGPTRGRPIIVMAPSDSDVDLKLLAASLGEKKLRMATQKEAEQLTGMRAGGISALALRRPGFEILIDERARERETVHVSAGQRGVEIELKVSDLVAVTGAQFVKASSMKSSV